MDEGIALMEKAVRIDPNSAEAQYDLGAALDHKGDVGEPLRIIRPLWESRPMIPTSTTNWVSRMPRKGRRASR